MSASFDVMTCELMDQVIANDPTIDDLLDKVTDTQLMVYLFNKAHTLELIAMKEQAEAALEAKYDELMEDA